LYDLGLYVGWFEILRGFTDYRLYGLKFAKLSASAGDFLNFISYNWSVLLQLASEQGLAGYCSHVYLNTKRCLNLRFKTY
jgi:hypothetical protein